MGKSARSRRSPPTICAAILGHMNSTKLSQVNPYLRDPVARERGVFASVASSSAIEGIHAPFKQMPRPGKARTAPVRDKRSKPRLTQPKR